MWTWTCATPLYLNPAASTAAHTRAAKLPSHRAHPIDRQSTPGGKRNARSHDPPLTRLPKVDPPKPAVRPLRRPRTAGFARVECERIVEISETARVIAPLELQRAGVIPPRNVPRFPLPRNPYLEHRWGRSWYGVAHQ